MDTSAISGRSLQSLKFPSAIKHTGADIIVAHNLYKKTTVSSDGYIFITWVCEMPHNSNLAFVTLIRLEPCGHSFKFSISPALKAKTHLSKKKKIWSLKFF